MPQVELLMTSPGSNYWSQPEGQVGSYTTHLPQQIEIHAGKGILGDRFYDFKENYKGQVTFFSYDFYLELKNELTIEFPSSAFRRNILISGINPIHLLHKEFKVGEVSFEGMADCTPCKWMDTAIGEGTYDWLNKNKAGGLRARALTSGQIQIGDSLEIEP